MIWYYAAIFAVGLISGATATVAGFGIGSLLTPLFTFRFGAGVAVAAVTLPHAAATALRCWRLRKNVNRAVLERFGFLSAAGGLAGALLYTRVGTSLLARILGVLLLLTASAQWIGWAARWRPQGFLVAIL